MRPPAIRASFSLSTGEHFSCSLSAAVLVCVRKFGGADAVERVLRESGCSRSIAYLEEAGNWLSFSEAVALIDAGEAITGDPHFARHLGERAIPTVKGSPVADMLRRLGTPEEAYRRIAAASAKMNLVTRIEAREVDTGYAELLVTPRPGFPRARQHCEWTLGLLSQPPLAFGLPPGVVQHDECAADGASRCRYRVRWSAAAPGGEEDLASQVASLRDQLQLMTDRVERLFATAADLVSSGHLEVTLARIVERATQELRTPRCLLAVRLGSSDGVRCHQLGLDAREADRLAGLVLADDGQDLPSSWLVAPVASRQRDYGRLVAMYDGEELIFPQERRLLDVYARYAATALDSATALLEAERRQQEASALLKLARALADTATSAEIASRLAETVPEVVDCDRVAVYLWEEETRQLVRKALNRREPSDREPSEFAIGFEQLGRLREYVELRRSEPLFVDSLGSDTLEARLLADRGAVASIVVPILTSEHFLGLLTVSVTADPQRLRMSSELLDRLSGVGAHAVTALQNGRLVDSITHQARHDPLTGLANRIHFKDQLSRATSGQGLGALSVFYIDLDGFKAINDRFGHAAGDELLRQVATRLSESVRPQDTVGRLGGDEFAAIVVGIRSQHEIERVAERLEGVFAAAFKIGGRELGLAASIGRVDWPADAQEVELLIQQADTAMYAMKRARAKQGVDSEASFADRVGRHCGQNGN